MEKCLSHLKSLKSIWRQQSINMQILIAGITVGSVTLLVNFATFLKDILIASQFGTGDAFDSFLIALVLPLFIINIVAGSLNYALIPTYIKVKEKEGLFSASELLTQTTFLSIILLVVVSIVLAILSPIILPLIASGFDKDKLLLTQQLFYIMLPLITIKGLSTIWGAVLNANERFALVGLTPIFWPLITIILAFFMVDKWGIYILIYGLYAGFIIEACILGLAIKRQNSLLFILRIDSLNRHTKHVVKQYLPMIAGAFLMGSSGVVNQAMAAMLSPGSVSSLNYGNKIVSFVVGLGGTAIGTAVLPYFSNMVANENWSGIRHTLVTYIRLIVLITVPVTLLMIFFSEPLVKILFQRGAFTVYDTFTVTKIQQLFLIQIPFYIIGIMIVRLISALSSNHILMEASLINLIINIFLNYLFIKLIGVGGIALSTSLVYIVSLIYCSIRLHHTLNNRRLLSGEG